MQSNSSFSKIKNNNFKEWEMVRANIYNCRIKFKLSFYVRLNYPFEREIGKTISKSVYQFKIVTKRKKKILFLLTFPIVQPI